MPSVSALLAAWCVFAASPSPKPAEPLVGGKPLADWRAKLQDPDVTLRRHAASALLELWLDARPAVAVAAAGLCDSDREVRFNSVRLLYALGPAARDAAPALLDRLADSDPVVALLAANTLGRIGKPVLGDLIKALRHSDPKFRKGAAEGLQRLGEDAEPAVPDLVKALSDSDGDVQIAATWALAALGPKAEPAVRHFLHFLRDPELFSSGRGIYAVEVAVSRVGDAAVPGVLQMAKDDDEKIRAMGIRTLRELAVHRNLGGRVGDAVGVLRQALKNGRGLTATDAAAALAQIGSAAHPAAPELIAELNKRGLLNRIRAAQALAAIGPKANSASVCMALRAALNDKEPSVRVSAAAALGAIGEADEAVVFLTKLIAERETNDLADSVSSAAEALGAMGPHAKTAVPALRGLMERGDTWERACAADALVRIGAPENTQVVLLSVVKECAGKLSKRPGVIRAAQTLGIAGVDPGPAMTALTDIVARGETDIVTCAAAVDYLARFGPKAKNAVPQLIATLRYATIDLRMAVIRALGAIGPDATAAMPVVRNSLADGNPGVRAAAAEAIRKLEAK